MLWSFCGRILAWMWQKRAWASLWSCLVMNSGPFDFLHQKCWTNPGCFLATLENILKVISVWRRFQSKCKMSHFWLCFCGAFFKCIGNHVDYVATLINMYWYCYITNDVKIDCCLFWKSNYPVLWLIDIKFYSIHLYFIQFYTWINYDAKAYKPTNNIMQYFLNWVINLSFVLRTFYYFRNRAMPLW